MSLTRGEFADLEHNGPQHNPPQPWPNKLFSMCNSFKSEYISYCEPCHHQMTSVQISFLSSIFRRHHLMSGICLNLGFPPLLSRQVASGEQPFMQSLETFCQGAKKKNNASGSDNEAIILDTLPAAQNQGDFSLPMHDVRQTPVIVRQMLEGIPSMQRWTFFVCNILFWSL